MLVPVVTDPLSDLNVQDQRLRYSAAVVGYPVVVAAQVVLFHSPHFGMDSVA